MAFDGMVTFAMVKELKDSLLLGKIEKIYQPHPEQILINIHTQRGGKKLLLSAASSHSAVYLIDRAPENPAAPPVFCMVLRKHLSGGRITDITQHENDRIVEILLETVNEMGFSVSKKLIIEIMGKHSNIVLTDMNTGRIIDSIKRVSIDVNRARQLLPGKAYQYPPSQGKTPFTEVSSSEMNALIHEQPRPEKAVLENIQGISPALAETIAASASPYDYLQELISSVNNGAFTSVLYMDESQEKPVEFHITPLSGFSDTCRALYFDTLSAAVCQYFTGRESSNMIKQKANDLKRVIKAQEDKLRLKIQRLEEDLYRAENSEEYRLFGELLTANLHSIPAGADRAEVTSYYDGSTVSIPLDPRLSPSRNAQRYYKKYGKSKTAVKEKKIQLDEAFSELEYLDSVSSFADMASSVDEIELLRRELTDSGFIRYRKQKKDTAKKRKPAPYSYILPSGLRVMAGRNNNENDWLTSKKAASSDIWLHTKDIPGSHVILFLEGRDPSHEDIEAAAAIAAFHSKGRASENVPVDYTKVKYVKKPSGAKPGKVIFTHNRTVYVNPQLP